MTMYSFDQEPATVTGTAIAGFLAAMLVCVLGWLFIGGSDLMAKELIETPVLKARVTSGELPPVAKRLPLEPAVFKANGKTMKPGKHGGSMRLLMGRSKDMRLVVVYGYSRLVRYDEKFSIIADILKSHDVKEERIFTFTLRKGHRWSDGQPFTTDDFGYYWDDMVNNKVIFPLGPPASMLVEGKLPKFEIIDKQTVRYSWHKPNPFFLSSLAGPSPLYIYRPAHYLKKFHKRYASAEKLQEMVARTRKRNWRALHYSKDRQYRSDNIDLPVLQPWINTTQKPSTRFVFKRNPYYHRIDENGRQLPYADEVVVTIASGKLIAAKTGTGEADLQARHLDFSNVTFLKQGEKRSNYKLRLWTSGKGARLALYPNLNVKDLKWRKLLRNSDFRKALSLAINRSEINQQIFFGLADETNNTVRPQSPLFKEKYRNSWSQYDPQKANALLDSLGLEKKNGAGIRLASDGTALEIIVESAGESSEQSDILQLISDSWRQVGIKLFTKPMRREVLRRRAKAGETVMSISFGLNNGLASANSSPAELAPTQDDQLQWARWGNEVMIGKKDREPIKMPQVKRLEELYHEWINATDSERKKQIWHEMLDIHADNMFSIGLVAGVPQPVVISNRLHNVPVKGLYNWDPGAHFGLYRPATFWFD